MLLHFFYLFFYKALNEFIFLFPRKLYEAKNNLDFKNIKKIPGFSADSGLGELVFLGFSSLDSVSNQFL